jgi:hypothetical protein
VLATLQAETPTPDRCRPHEAPSPDARASPGIPTPDQQNGLLRVGHHAPAAMDHAVTGAVDGMSPP